MNRREILEETQRALNEIPYAVGVNNHMGSLFTTKRGNSMWCWTFWRNRIYILLTVAQRRVASATSLRTKKGSQQRTHAVPR